MKLIQFLRRKIYFKVTLINFLIISLLIPISAINAESAPNTLTVATLDIGQGKAPSVIVINQPLEGVSVPLNQPDISYSVNKSNPLGPSANGGSGGAVICVQCDGGACEADESKLASCGNTNLVKILGKTGEKVVDTSDTSTAAELISKALKCVAQAMHSNCCKGCTAPVEAEEQCEKLQNAANTELSKIQSAMTDIQTSSQNLQSSQAAASKCLMTEDLKEKSSDEDASKANMYELISKVNSDENVWKFHCKESIKAAADALSGYYKAQKTLADLINKYIAAQKAQNSSFTLEQLEKIGNQLPSPSASSSSSTTSATQQKTCKELYSTPKAPSVFSENVTNLKGGNLQYSWVSQTTVKGKKIPGHFKKFKIKYGGLVKANAKGGPINKAGKVIADESGSSKDQSEYQIVNSNNVLYTACLIIQQISNETSFREKQCKSLLTNSNWKTLQQKASKAQKKANEGKMAGTQIWGLISGAIGLLTGIGFIVHTIHSGAKQKEAEKTRSEAEESARKTGFDDPVKAKLAEAEGFTEDNFEGKPMEARKAFQRYQDSLGDESMKGIDLGEGKDIAENFKKYESLKKQGLGSKDDWESFKEAEGKGFKFGDGKDVGEEFKDFEDAGGTKRFKDSDDWENYKKARKIGQQEDSAGTNTQEDKELTGKTITQDTETGGATTEQIENFNNLPEDVRDNIESVKTYDGKLYAKETGSDSYKEVTDDGLGDEVESDLNDEIENQGDDVSLSGDDIDA